MKSIILILAVMAAAVGAANATTVSEYREGKEITLAPLETPRVKEITTCGRFFYRTTEDAYPGGPLVTLRVEKGGVGIFPSMHKNEFWLVINPSKRVPTITFVPTLPRLQDKENPRPYFWIIQMDRQAWWKGKSCFPQPAPDPRAI